ncbi:copper resistance protein [Pectobacteriaceae bacterium CE70]|uniref:Copper resistance protein n=1 Tax=Serratia sp. (strain ATCC 39006) TaxID=104623 RepID=A0A2I5T2A6_SERS3|nr:copper resistance protein [Serratia sp. ATCC 39006]AUH03031.1 copper resistance protein [Serratia sp. ATCC 39006]WJV62626.1 copper resistance protein [Pectobacteriaceae bacterium C52]WJV66951.1 copper resistance protein [Pectobacteriaceae bacterium CE70]
MHKRHQIGKGFLVLAGIILLACIAQRIANQHSLYLSHAHEMVTLADQSDKIAPVSPCQLSAHSLLMTQPLFFESPLLFLGSLLAFLAFFIQPIKQLTSYPPEREHPPPVLRIHLKNCVFRE